MTGASILSADMTTIARWFRSGFRWWIDELAGLSSRDLGAAGTRAPILVFDGTDALTRQQRDGTIEAVGAAAAPRAATVGFSATRCLFRALELPRMSARDLTRMVVLDADRLMPSPGGRMIVAARATGADPAGRLHVEIAGVALDEARALANTCAALNIVPVRIMVDDYVVPRRAAFDFAPAMRAAGLLAAPNAGRAIWWAIAAFMVFANIVALVARDYAATEQIGQLVSEQQPAVAIADRIKRKLANDQARVAQTLARREGSNAVAAMVIVAEVLPRGAWVQRFDWREGKIQLAGYKLKGVDVIAALRASPRLTEVRQASGSVAADIPIGQPFELSARVKVN